MENNIKTIFCLIIAVIACIMLLKISESPKRERYDLSYKDLTEEAIQYDTTCDADMTISGTTSINQGG